MSTRPQQFEPGDALMGCSICPCVELLSKMWYGDDRLYYCERHVEFHTHVTKQTDSNRRASWRPPTERVPEFVGPRPDYRSDDP